MWRDSASVDTYLMQCFSKYTSCFNTRKKHSSAATLFPFFSPSFFPLCLFFLFLTSVSIVLDEPTENHKQQPQRIYGWVPTKSQICVENLGLMLSLQHLTAVCDLVMCRVTTYKEEQEKHKHYGQVRAWRGLIESVDGIYLEYCCRFYFIPENETIWRYGACTTRQQEAFSAFTKQAHLGKFQTGKQCFFTDWKG